MSLLVITMSKLPSPVPYLGLIFSSCGVENLCRRVCLFFFQIDTIDKDSDDSEVYECYRMIWLHIRCTLAQDDFCIWLIWQRYCDIRVVVKSELTAYPPHPGSKLIFVCDWSLMIIKKILRWKLTAYPPHPGSAFSPRTPPSPCLDLNRF